MTVRIERMRSSILLFLTRATLVILAVTSLVYDQGQTDSHPVRIANPEINRPGGSEPSSGWPLLLLFSAGVVAVIAVIVRRSEQM